MPRAGALGPRPRGRSVRVRSLAPRDEPEGGAPWILFVAGFGHPPNAEAAAWFVPICDAGDPGRRADLGQRRPVEVAGIGVLQGAEGVAIAHGRLVRPLAKRP